MQSLWRKIEAATTAHRLRGCTRVGARPVLRGIPVIRNEGELTIGDDLHLVSTPVQSHFYVTSGARLTIGHRVCIGAGAALSSLARVDIEDDVSLGDYVIVLDSDFHVAANKATDATPRPVRIGRRARLGHRVVVLPGSTVGADAVVRSGSVVSGRVAEGTIVEGNPARPVSELAREETAEIESIAERIPRLVMQVLGLSSLPGPNDGPAQIGQWDSLGALRIIVALDEQVGVSLSDDDLKAVRSIGELVGRVEAVRRARQAATAQAVRLNG